MKKVILLVVVVIVGSVITTLVNAQLGTSMPEVTSINKLIHQIMYMVEGGIIGLIVKSD